MKSLQPHEELLRAQQEIAATQQMLAATDHLRSLLYHELDQQYQVLLVQTKRFLEQLLQDPAAIWQKSVQSVVLSHLKKEDSSLRDIIKEAWEKQHPLFKDFTTVNLPDDSRIMLPSIVCDTRGYLLRNLEQEPTLREAMVFLGETEYDTAFPLLEEYAAAILREHPAAELEFSVRDSADNDSDFYIDHNVVNTAEGWVVLRWYTINTAVYPTHSSLTAALEAALSKLLGINR